MKVTVLGATGHLGHHLVGELVAGGHQVRAIVRKDKRAIEGFEVEPVSADLFDVPSLEAAFTGSGIVYHLPGRISLVAGDEDLVRKTNIDGVRNVLEAFRTSGARRLIHYSSVHAISPVPIGDPIVETRPLADHAGVPLYDFTKASGQRLVQEA